MIWVLLVASVAFAVFFTQYAWRHRKSNPCGSFIGAFFGWMVVITVVAAACSLTTAYLGYGIIDDKIAIIEEENGKIELQVEEAVKQYQNYESGIFTDASQDVDSDVLVLVERYPEIKSNVMVLKQIELYQQNNREIRELRLKKLDKYIYELWLFFDLKV